MARVLLAGRGLTPRSNPVRALRREGYDVDITADGPSTLYRALGEGVDLILLDIGLPDLDGLEVCKEARAREDTSRPGSTFPIDPFPQLERMIHDQRRSLRQPIPNRRIPQPSPNSSVPPSNAAPPEINAQNFHPNCR